MRVIRIFILFIVMVLTPMTAMAYGNSYAGEMNYLIGRMNEISSSIIQNGDTIVHIEADLLKVGETYSRTRMLFEGKEYYVISVGCAGINGIGTTIFNQYSQAIPTRYSSSVTGVRFYVPSSGYYNITNTIYGLNPGYNPGTPYYFFFVVAYVGQ